MARDNYQCQYCGKRILMDSMELDHLVPFSRGGNDSSINLVSSCRTCNRNKGSLLLSETMIKKFQEDIIQRTKTYEEHLSKYPVLDTKSRSDTFKKPIAILSSNPKIKELFSNRSFHPNKEHHIVIHIIDNKLSSISYSRYYKDKWETVDNVEGDTSFTPLLEQEYNQLIQGNSLYRIDKTTETHEVIDLLTNEKGLYLIKVQGMDKKSLIYACWIKGKDIKLHISTNAGINADNYSENY